MFYFAYLVGTWIIGEPPMNFNFELSFEWLLHELEAIWKPFLIGCFTVASISSLLGYLAVDGFWRYDVNKRRRQKFHLRK
jgi:uncharacterized protein (DUF2062 family)